MLYTHTRFATKAAFKRAIKQAVERGDGIPVYDPGVQPITNQARPVKTKRIGGKQRRVIIDTLTGPSAYERNWYAEIALDADAFENGELRVIWAK